MSNFMLGQHEQLNCCSWISCNEVFWRNYCTVYNKGESQNNNINNTVLIIDHAKIVTKVEDSLPFVSLHVVHYVFHVHPGHYFGIVNAFYHIII